MILALVAFVATAINNMQFKIYNSDAIYKNHNFWNMDLEENGKDQLGGQSK